MSNSRSESYKHRKDILAAIRREDNAEVKAHKARIAKQLERWTEEEERDAQDAYVSRFVHSESHIRATEGGNARWEAMRSK